LQFDDAIADLYSHLPFSISSALMFTMPPAA
jgi:hypothetical protein